MRLRIRKESFLLLWVAVFLLASSPVWSAAGDEGARRLSPQGADNLAAFAKLLGYVRFFHPSDQAAGADWNQVAIAGVQRIENAADPADLAQLLQSFFQPLAPTLRVYTDGNRPVIPAELFPPGGTGNPMGTYWRHRGVNVPGTPPFTYTNARIDWTGAPPPFTGLPLPSNPLEVSLGRGVRALLPLTLYKGDAGTIPATSAPAPVPDKPAGWTPSGNDRATRLADVSLAWSTLQHFFPYFPEIQADWPALLEPTLIAAAQDPDERAFVDTLRELMANLQDGHARVTHPSWPLGYQLPLVWTWLDNQLVITWADPAAATGLEPGDIVLMLNGRPAEQIYRQELALAPGMSPQHKRSRALNIMLLGAENEEVRLRVLKHHGGVQETTVRRTYFVNGPGGFFLTEPRPDPIAEVRPGIFYVDLDRIDDFTFIDAADQLATARGIVFDLRQYPFNFEWYTPLLYLATSDLISPPVDMPIVYRPDRQGWTFLRLQFPDTPLEPHINAKVAFITAGANVSFAETFMGTVQGYHLGETVGEPTGGTNGAANSMSLPGGYQLRFTGERVTKNDGSRLYGVGFQPTVPVERTYEGIAAGRDEVLEKAIEVVSQ